MPEGVFLDRDYEETEVAPKRPDFETYMLERVMADFTNAKQFMSGVHSQCLEAYQQYHSALEFENLRQSYEFPVPFVQEHVDQATADAMDKLFYKSRPATVVPVEDTDKLDAEAKQKMMDWQDYKDQMYWKLHQLFKDCALYRFCVAKVDYVEETKRDWVIRDVPVTQYDPQTFEPVVQMVPQWTVEDVPVYKGPRVTRIDPLSFFVTQDKGTVGDEHPVMVRSFETKQFFQSKPYFIQENVAGLATKKEGTKAHEQQIDQKRSLIGLQPDVGRTKRPFEYIEWQGMVNRKVLYEYLEADENQMALVKPGERVRTIVGVVNGDTVVRLEETPFYHGNPNVIVGCIIPEEDNVVGSSLYDRIVAVAKGQNTMMGVILENLKQSVNAGWIIDVNKVQQEGDIKVNVAGWILRVSDDVNKCAKRAEQPRIAPDAFNLMAMFKEFGESADGYSAIPRGKGDEAAETLGEANIVATQASLRLRDYLKMFETTVIQPLYEMRNQVNMQFLDEMYVYGVIGEGVIEWREIEPTRIRSAVDFICESSTRETNRLVITHQVMRFAEAAQGAIAVGFPVRLDFLLEQLAEQGFSWPRELIEKILPTLPMERRGENVEQYIAQRQMMMAAMGKTNEKGGGPHASSPQPMSDAEAISQVGHESSVDQTLRQ